MLESSIQKQVVNKAEEAGWFVRPMQWRNRVGAPDYFFLKEGRHVFIEFKRPNGGSESKMQTRERKRMMAQKAECHVCDDFEDARKILGI